MIVENVNIPSGVACVRLIAAAVARAFFRDEGAAAVQQQCNRRARVVLSVVLTYAWLANTHSPAVALICVVRIAGSLQIAVVAQRHRPVLMSGRNSVRCADLINIMLVVSIASCWQEKLLWP